MDTVDKADQVQETTTKRRGRPAKAQAAEPTTPQGEMRKKQAQEFHEKKQNAVVEKWYEIRGHKLSLCKKVKSGAVYRTYVGSTEDKQNGKEIRAFMERKQAEGMLRVKV